MKPKRIKKQELLVLATCVGLSIIIHRIFMVSGFAEPDAARLALLAAEWQQTGTFSTYSYVLRTSPLYLHMIKIILELGVPLKTLPAVMNWGNVLFGSLSLIPLFFLWRILLNRHVAVIACFLFSFTPTFWLANICGMPHLPSFFFFITALLLFGLALLRSNKNRIALLVVSFILAIISATLKADIILCFAAFFGLTFYFGALNRRNIVLSVLVPVSALIVVVVYTKMITPPLVSFGDSATEWANKYPFTIHSLLSRENSLILANSAGKFLFSVAILSIAYCIIWRTHLRSLLLILVWALPPILFWGLKYGNSARHLMASYSVLMFLVAIIIVTLIEKKRMQILLIALLLTSNYWISPSEGGLGSPTSQLHRLTVSIHAFSDYRHRVSSAFADVEVDQKLYVGAPTIPYIVWESILKAQSFDIAQMAPKVFRLKRENNTVNLLRVDEAKSPSTVGPENDWLVFSLEPGIKVLNTPRFEKYYTDLTATARRIRQQIDE